MLGLSCCSGFSLVAAKGGGLLSSCGAGILIASGSSCFGAQALTYVGFSSCNAQAE